MCFHPMPEVADVLSGSRMAAVRSPSDNQRFGVDVDAHSHASVMKQKASTTLGMNLNPFRHYH